MIGFSWLSGCVSTTEPVIPIPKAWFEINGYIKIADTGLVTIFSPNPEIGQNVKTSMPLIVAEELDVGWEQVQVEQAALNTDIFQRQLAGGSQSIRQGWNGLRMAGATARKLLLDAAAQTWSVDVSELTVDKGIISHKSSDRKIGYGAVASLAATLTVPENVELKEIKDFSLIGSRVKNVDSAKIVTGKPLFGIDYHREGMLIAMIIHPPAFGLKLKTYDATLAKSMSGIKDVFTINTAPPERQWSDTNAFPDLVAIVGESTWQVLKAKKSIEVEWETVTAAESTSDYEKSILEAIDHQSGEIARVDGYPDQAFAGADVILERSYTAPFLAHNTMEPMNFFADVTDTHADLVGPIQTPEFLEKSLSSLIGLPLEQINIDMTRMGGGFGRRLYGHFGLEAAVISQKVQAPIKLMYTREDDMTQGTYRPPYRIKYRAALDQDKNLVGFEAKGVGVGSSPLFANRYPAGAVPNYRIENLGIESNISTGAWRAPSSNFTAAAEQSFLDEIAELAGKDPVDFRLDLFEKATTQPIGENNDYDVERYVGVINLVKEKANWGADMPGVYRGMAAYFCHQSYVAQIVDLVKVEGTIKIKKVWCAVDCGIVVNLEGALNQIEGGIVDGLGHAMYSAMTFKEGSPNQQNFHNYRLMRHMEAPEAIETFFVESDIAPTGLGEPTLPPVMGALANALYQATGKRYYDQPYMA